MTLPTIVVSNSCCKISLSFIDYYKYRWLVASQLRYRVRGETTKYTYSILLLITLSILFLPYCDIVQAWRYFASCSTVDVHWHTSSTVFLRAAKKTPVHSQEIFLIGQHFAAQTMATFECASSTKPTYIQSRYQLIRYIFRILLPPCLIICSKFPGILHYIKWFQSCTGYISEIG